MKSLPYKASKALGRFLSDLKTLPSAVFEEFDEVLHKIGSKKMDQVIDKAKKLAMLNPEYADIESRRHIDGGNNIILFSEADGLTFDDWERQMEIENEVAPQPPIMKVYRFLYDRPLSSFVGQTQAAYQRLTRGWDDTATWSLDYHLTSTLGAQLKHLADTTHGWPQSDKFPTFEDWQKALNKNGDLLLAYSKKDEIMFATDELYDPAFEEKTIKGAQRALRWVSDNLPALWD